MTLNPPYGGELKQLLVSGEQAAELGCSIPDEDSWVLQPRQLCDVELLLTGAFSPLEGFMGRRDYERCLDEMRLAGGLLWPVPVTLDVSEAFATRVQVGGLIGLRDEEGVLIAALEVSDVWRPDRRTEAERLYGSTDPAHPGVNVLLNHTEPVYVGGRLLGCNLPVHYDFKYLRDTPADLRERFEARGWVRVIGFHTGNVMHRLHRVVTEHAAQQAEANLLLHPAVGVGYGDTELVDRFSRVRSYERMLGRYPDQLATLSVLPLAGRGAGPREALLHAIVRKNYGCSHFIVGPRQADPGPPETPRYEPGGAQALAKAHEAELGIEVVPVEERVYVSEWADYVPVSSVSSTDTVLRLGQSELRRRLEVGLEIPTWCSDPEVVEELRVAFPPRHQQGVTVFFTGLSGAGKSSIANALRVKLLELGRRRVTLLDGDIVRKHLSSELGFSRAHRDVNIRRIGFVASEITKHGGIAICAPIAPYRETRDSIRDMIEAVGGFVEVYVSTPLDVCEARDRKGLYARARQGIIQEFTGVSDPYEAPDRPELEIDTRVCTPDEAAHRVLLKLEGLGYIR